MILSLLMSLLLTVSVTATASECRLCSLPLPPQALTPGQSDACEDLYGAACLNPDGSQKYRGEVKKLNEELAANVSAARDKAAQQMGYKNMEEAYRGKLKEAGLTVKGRVDANAWKVLRGEEGGDPNGLAERLFEQPNQCQEERENLMQKPASAFKTAAEMQKQEKALVDFRDKYKTIAQQHYVADLSYFFTDVLKKECDKLQQAPQRYTSSKNPRAVQVCSKAAALRREAVDLFRREDSPGYQAEALRFVRDNWLDPLVENLDNPDHPTPSGVSAARESMIASAQNAMDVCEGLSAVMENHAKLVVDDLNEVTAKSQPVVETLVDGFYTPQRNAQANSLFTMSRADLSDLASDIAANSQKEARIRQQYGLLQLQWMQKPAPSAYKKDASGLMVLDTDKLSETDDLGPVFSDPKLSHFTTLNAFYSPEASSGILRKPEHVAMMPAFLKIMDKYPYAFMGVVAHEAGHKIDPNGVKINGYDLNSQYGGLKACYKDPKSIRMQDNQVGEAFADYFSSEVVAKEVMQLPKEKRRAAIMASVSGFCLFSEMGIEHFGINCREVHPDDYLRASGIFGANPSIRKVMGCTGDSKKFKTCGLEKSILGALSEETVPESTGKAQ